MKFLIVLACVAMASAVGNYRQSYSSYSSGGGYGGVALGGLTAARAINIGGLASGGALRVKQLGGASLGYGGALGYQTQQAVPVTVLVSQPSVAAGRVHSGGLVEAAVISNRQVQVVDVPSTPIDATPAQVVIPPSVQGVNLEFQSQSSPVTVTANHIPGQAAPPQEYSHQEDADVVRQNIVKPVIHEVNEVITPFRRVSQEVKPVQEEISQVLATGRREVPRIAYAQTATVAQPTILALVADGASSGLVSSRASGSLGLAGLGARSLGYGSYGVASGAPTLLVSGGSLGGLSGGITGGLGGSILKTRSNIY